MALVGFTRYLLSDQWLFFIKSLSNSDAIAMDIESTSSSASSTPSAPSANAWNSAFLQGYRIAGNAYLTILELSVTLIRDYAAFYYLQHEPLTIGFLFMLL